MELGDREKRTIALALNERGVTNVCPACKHTPLDIDRSVMDFREFLAPDARLGPQAMPVFALACSKCGHIMLFHAVAYGLIAGLGNADIIV